MCCNISTDWLVCSRVISMWKNWRGIQLGFIQQILHSSYNVTYVHVQLHSKYFKISKYSSHTVHLCTHNGPLTFPIKTLSPCSTLSSVYELCGRNSVHQGVCGCGCVGVGVGVGVGVHALSFTTYSTYSPQSV